MGQRTGRHRREAPYRPEDGRGFFMRVTVNIYAYLRYYLPAGEDFFRNKEWDVADGATVGHVMERLQMPPEIRITVLLNGSRVDETAVLKDGDVVHLLPQTVGG